MDSSHLVHRDTNRASRTKRPTALIVEDDRVVAALLARTAEQCGLICVTRPTVAAARQLLATARFDLILLDLLLPDGSGEDILGFVRRQGVDSAVVVVSGLRDVAVRVRVLDGGADDFVAKPFDVEELACRIRKATKPAGAHRSRVIFDGRLNLDPVSRRVYSSSLSERCTAVEFGITWLLAGTPGDFVPSSDVCTQVFGPDSSNMGASDGFISNSRTKYPGTSLSVNDLNNRGVNGSNHINIMYTAGGLEAIRAQMLRIGMEPQ